ncbi:MAG: PH domain-containing protein, partial [Nitriliruptoraceae bacterium]
MPSEPGLGRFPPPPPPPSGAGGFSQPSGAGGCSQPSGAGGFSQPRRLHPASVLLGVPLAQAVQALIFPVVATLAAPPLFTIVALAGFAIIGLIVRSLDWRLRTFSFDGEVLRVDHGILSRNHRSLDVSRIQQVEIQRGAVQRVFGLPAIRVETAGSASEPEVDLRVLPEADAVALRAAVRISQDRLAGRHTVASG